MKVNQRCFSLYARRVISFLLFCFGVREVYHLTTILLEFLPYTLTGISFETVESGKPMVRQFDGFKIPRNIHQLWRSPDVSMYTKNTSCHAWRQQYETKGWTYKLWTDADVIDLLTQHDLWLLPQYQSYPYDIQRADLARLLILYHEGGMYVDLDGFPWTTHLDTYPELLMYDVVLSKTNDGNLISNHFFLARKHSSFLAYCLYHSHRAQVVSPLVLLLYPYIPISLHPYTPILFIVNGLTYQKIINRIP